MARRRYWTLKFFGKLGYGISGRKVCSHEAPTCAGIGYQQNQPELVEIDAPTHRRLLRAGHRDCKRCSGMK